MYVDIKLVKWVLNSNQTSLPSCVWKSILLVFHVPIGNERPGKGPIVQSLVHVSFLPISPKIDM